MMTRKQASLANKRIRSAGDGATSTDEGLAEDDMESMHKDGRDAPTTDDLLNRLPHRPARRPVPAKKNKRVEAQSKAKCRRRNVSKGRTGKARVDGEVINVREGESFVLDDNEREASFLCSYPYTRLPAYPRSMQLKGQ